MEVGGVVGRIGHGCGGVDGEVEEAGEGEVDGGVASRIVTVAADVDGVVSDPLGREPWRPRTKHDGDDVPEIGG